MIYFPCIKYPTVCICSSLRVDREYVTYICITRSCVGKYWIMLYRICAVHWLIFMRNLNFWSNEMADLLLYILHHAAATTSCMTPQWSQAAAYAYTCITLVYIYIDIYIHTVETLYNTINFCWSTHKRHSIARPKGRGMGCLLWVQRATYCVDLSILSSIKYLL